MTGPAARPGSTGSAAPAGPGPVHQAQDSQPAVARRRAAPVWRYFMASVSAGCRLGTSAIAVLMLAPDHVAVAGPRDDLAAARDDRRGRAMAHGDYTRRVRATSRDEVGQLAEAFNQMAADLAAADRQRRELIANVSHELRTPITALQGVLENMVDGVAEPDPETLQTALAQTERLGRLVTELLDLSRIDAGVVPLDRDEFDVAEFLERWSREARSTPAAPAGTCASASTGSAGDRGGRPGPPAPGGGQPAGQRGPAQPARRHGPRDRRRDERPLLIEVTDEGPGIPAGRARTGLRPVHPGRPAGAGGGTGLGPGHRPLGRGAARRQRSRSSTRRRADRRAGCRIRVSLPAESWPHPRRPPQPGRRRSSAG